MHVCTQFNVTYKCCFILAVDDLLSGAFDKIRKGTEDAIKKGSDVMKKGN